MTIRELKHEHLKMALNCSEPDVIEIDMNRHTDQMVKKFSCELKETIATSANANPFKVFKVKKPAEEEKQVFHTFVVKALHCWTSTLCIDTLDLASLEW